MPLCTAIYDADTTTPRSVRWGWWHVVCMTLVAQAHYPETEGMAVLDTWSYPALQNGMDVEFGMGFKDPDDGEVLVFNPGDRLEIWRE